MILYTLLPIFFFAAALILHILAKTLPQGFLLRIGSWFSWILSVFLLISTSFVIVDQESVGHLKRIYFANDLKPGQIIAKRNQKGPQALILGPGFHFIPFVNLLYKVEEFGIVNIPDGTYGHLLAKDGAPLENQQYMARKWPDDTFDQMLDAEYFLKNGGQKGPQLSVLKPGSYRINRYLFDVDIYKALNVEAGEVAVIKSNVEEIENCPDQKKLTLDSSDKKQGTELSLPVVPVGCVGVWDMPLLPGRYYLNSEAYMPTLIQTRAQTWVYGGDYEKRLINLTVDESGKINQEVWTKHIEMPRGATGKAVIVMVEGWRVPLDIRAVVQIEPQNAPRVVASVGGLQEVEDRIVTPALRSIVRNVAGAPGRQVLDLINHRDTLETLVEEAIFLEGQKAGVTIKEIRFGDPVIPAALLVARQRQQLADQLDVTYERERIAQEKRINVEKSRATADQQTELVRAQIAVQIAEQQKLQAKLQGEGEKLRLQEIARGQLAQVKVLGKESVFQLAELEKVLKAATTNANIVKVPSIYVQGQGEGFEGAAAVLGASSLVQAISKKQE